jgi:hypothetical protein
MRNGCSLSELAVELHRQISTKRDLVVPSSHVTHSTDLGRAALSVALADGGRERYGVTDIARRQLAEKLKIPYAYFERMRENQPKLLDDNINTWLHVDDEPRMLRTLDGNVRAVLSNRYRRIDNHELVETIFPILNQLPGMRFESLQLTETRMYIKCVTTSLRFEVAPGDIVQGGLVVTNSEVGHGTLTIYPLLYRLVCRNGLIVQDRVLRKTHLGRMVENGSDGWVAYKDETLEADDRALLLKVRDEVQSAVSQVSFAQAAQKMHRTLGIPISGNPVKAVEVLAQRYTLNDVERGGVLRQLIEGGHLSAFGLVNAVTHYSQEVADYDRATDMEALGGKLIELKPNEWKVMAEAE